jgi:hypothetical protein
LALRILSLSLPRISAQAFGDSGSDNKKKDHGCNDPEEDEHLDVVVVAAIGHRVRASSGRSERTVEVVLWAVVVISFVFFSSAIASPLGKEQ